MFGTVTDQNMSHPNDSFREREGKEGQQKILMAQLTFLSLSLPPCYLTELIIQQEIKPIHLTKNCLDVMCDYRWLIPILEDWSLLKIPESSILFIFFPKIHFRSSFSKYDL